MVKSEALVLAATVALAAACSDGSTRTDDAGASHLEASGQPEHGTCRVVNQGDVTAPDFVVGTRTGSLDGSFAPLAADTRLWLTPGEQGLQHLVLAFRGSGFESVNPYVQVTVVRAEDLEPVAYSRFRLPFSPVGGDPCGLMLGPVRILVIDGQDATEYCSLLDRDVNVIVDFDDGAGQVAHRESRVHIAGVDPSARSELREAWVDACNRRDAGIADAP